MSDQFAATRQAMVDLLRSPTCSGMSFRYKTCVVNGLQYGRVAADVQTNSITLEALQPGSGAAAQYDSRHCYVHTAFLTIPGLWPVDAPACVHEMTHAVYDQQCLGLQPALDSEIVAYVAEHLFRIRAGIPTAMADSISVPASGIARFIAGRPGSVITESMASNLLRALQQHRLYSRQRNLMLTSSGVGRCP